MQFGANLRLVFEIRINASTSLLKDVNDFDLAALSVA